MTNPIYNGNLTYSGLASASIVRRLQFLGTDWIAIDLTDQREHKGADVTTRFLGLAEVQEDGTFRTAWIYLSGPQGEALEELDEPYAQVTLSIIQTGTSTIEINGHWHEWGIAPYEFKGMLHRADA